MILETAKTGVRNLAANPLRSLLSMLGIVFGVATLVATLSVGEGTKRQILSSIEALGTNLVFISDQRSGWGTEQQTPGLVEGDVDYLRAQTDGLIDYVAPEQFAGRSVSYEARKRPSFMPCVGTTPEYIRIVGLTVGRGRFLHEKDVRAGARVCVVGARLGSWVGAGDLLGKDVTIDGVPFEVVGVLQAYGGAPGAQSHGPDLTIWIPISVSRAMSAEPLKLSRIVLAARSAQLVTAAADEVRRLLLMRHGVEDFSVGTYEELLDKWRTYTNMFSVALGSIAVMSLLVGGIGIMNILLAAVNERVREIGVRKALGATPLDILLQFLFESLILTLMGGAVGVALGRTLALQAVPLLNRHLGQASFQWHAATPVWTIALAFVFALGTGLVFGLYPAYKAGTLDPCEALTYE
ncbi:MAG: ABC transporter permease [Verrucomicrobia bacterium]|nr:ABC transporter permease [Verrucomicrobiota bacterium]